jgi:excisionase family DNA binding protein
MVENQTEGKQVLPKYISRAEAGRQLRVPPRTVDRLVSTLKLPCWQVPGHSRRWISAEAVQKLAQQATGVGESA